MNKLLLCVLTSASLCLAVSCGNNASKKTTEEPTKATDPIAAQLTEDLKIKLDSLVATYANITVSPAFAAARENKLNATEKEQLVKPDYLMPLTAADNLQTLSQKYRAFGIYVIDMSFAKNFGVNPADYEEVLARLALETNNQYFIDCLVKENETNVDINVNDNNVDFLINGAKVQAEAGTYDLYWELLGSSAVELLYIHSQDVDKYLAFIDDKGASDFTYHLVLVLEGVNELAPYYPGLKNMQEILAPLSVINAISVDQLRTQLTEMNSIIAAARENILK